MEQFYYDVLIDPEDFCNRLSEISQILKQVESEKKIVLYAPRRYGKSSLIKNIIGKQFTQKNKKSMVIYVNLMEVSSIESIKERLQSALTEAIHKYLPAKSIFDSAKNYFKGLALNISIDPFTGSPNLEIKNHELKSTLNLKTFFGAIEKLHKDYKILLIFDEFQDIHMVDEAEALLRAELQLLKKIPMAFLGSKRELLNLIFARRDSPFFNFGDEITLGPIAPSEWLPYFNKRLKGKKINLENITFLCDLMQQVPNAICECGAFFSDNVTEKNISRQVLVNTLDLLLENKEQNFRSQLVLLSLSEINLLKALAQNGFTKQINSKEFLQKTTVSSSGLRKIVEKLVNKGVIEFEVNKGYRVSDPLLGFFLTRRPV